MEPESEVLEVSAIVRVAPGSALEGKQSRALEAGSTA